MERAFYVKPGSPEEIACHRQDVVRHMEECLNRTKSLSIFPKLLKKAFELRCWSEMRIFGNGGRQPPVSFHDFIHKPYPIGIGATYDLVERVLADDTEALGLYTMEKGRGQGSRSDLVYNVHDVGKERPAGNAKEAGLRKLQKAAREGNDAAAAQLTEVKAGRKKVHTACVDAGLRKRTTLTAEERSRAALILAEIFARGARPADVATLVAEAPHTTLKDVIAALPAFMSADKGTVP